MRIARLLVLGLLTVVPSHPYAAAPGGVTGHVVVREARKQLDDKALGDTPAYVYLEPVKRRPKRQKPVRAQIDHVGQEFKPHVLVVPVGTPVAFPNKDSFQHNAFSPTPADSFDLGIYGQGDGPRGGHVFDAPGEIEIYCDIHPNMWATVKVIDSDWFAKVVNGSFTISNVPAGEYKLVAWLRNSEEVRSEPFAITEGNMVSLDFVPYIQKGKPKLSHTRKDGSAYPPY
jgi:plastocyanin